ncbi:MAG: T9SS type A sorting domain-containing protein, partial [Bacteroidota bacterium]
FNGLQEGESIGNAVFSKNSPNVIAFDFFNNNTNENFVLGANIETGDIGTIFQNSQLGFPTYSVDDGQLLFDTPVTVQGQSESGVAVIDLASDKVRPAGTQATALIGFARWAEWYADGQRSTNTNIDEFIEEGEFSLFPNPVENILRIEFEMKLSAEVQFEVLDIMGRSFYQSELKQRGIGVNTEEMRLGDLAPGVYLLQMQVEESVETLKFIKQ